MTGLISSAPHNSIYAVRSFELAYIPIDPLSGDEIGEDKVDSMFRVVDMLEAETAVVKVWTNLADG